MTREKLEYPNFSLEGKRALVSGAGRGIGLAAAAAFAHAGADVTLMARSEDELSRAVKKIVSQGGKATALPLDVTELEAVREAVATADPFDVLLNNAGTNRPAPFTEVAPADFDAVMELNVRAAFFLAQAVARRLKEAGRPGSIINVSSQMGHVGAAGRSVYCASKWAMEGFTKAMAVELGHFGIRVNTLCPTFIETPMTRPFLADPEFREMVVSKIKLGRIGQISDILGAAVFLASDASAFMTGSALMVDGGWTAE